MATYLKDHPHDCILPVYWVIHFGSGQLTFLITLYHFINFISEVLSATWQFSLGCCCALDTYSLWLTLQADFTGWINDQQSNSLLEDNDFTLDFSE